MTPFVLDCSVTMSWFFEDEASKETDAVLENLKLSGTWVPNLWHLEVLNSFMAAQRRQRINKRDIRKSLRKLQRLPINVDQETHIHGFEDTARIALENDLTSYDAAYIELAIRRCLPLATKDKAMSRAAIKLEIPLLLK